jgi:hypothetical protein
MQLQEENQRLKKEIETLRKQNMAHGGETSILRKRLTAVFPSQMKSLIQQMQYLTARILVRKFLLVFAA